jgi:serine/threonine protein kinase/WD40 repeat protein
MSDSEQNLLTIFSAALDCGSDEERAAYLDQACAGSPALRERVEALLRAHARAGSFLGQPTDDAEEMVGLEPANGAAPTSEHASGTLIAGRYNLLERIGEGGMGEVWMAEQREPIQRRVALKIIKAGMDTRQVVARFEAERQALALMNHPNIAKVHDAGATDSGRPYFVMELVKGTPITTYCDQHRLTLRQRLELFLPVCRAIQHAHQKGIIHRDIKPSNVLIAPYDGHPVPKMIDFGVAKAIGQRLTERTFYTGLGAVVGTLEYMSPEQAELNNQDIDTRSDIYTLGVLLYELLTGTTPISLERLTQTAFTEILRLVREEEPPKPSSRLSHSKETLQVIAAQRHTEPARLPKLVRGELDWIVMKTLEKDRIRRYETASGLARDIEHYLRDEPVQACPPTVGYRLRRLVRRHKGPVIAVGLVVLALVAGIIGTTWGLVRAEKARIDLRDQQTRTTAAERDKAWQHALSHWKEAQIARAARQPGQRWRSLEDLAAAVQHLRSLGQLEANRAEMRDDAISSLTLWDVRAVGHLPASTGLATPRIDPLGKYYAMAEAPNLVCWRRLADHRVVHRWQWEGPRCLYLEVSPDGRYVYAFCFDEKHAQKVCRVWDVGTGQEMLCHPSTGAEHAFRPDGKGIALVQADGSVALCELGTGRDLPSLPAGRMPECLRFHPGGRYLAISSHAHKDAEVWDVAARTVVLRLPGARYAGATLAWSPDGSLLALGSNDHNIYLCSFPGGHVQAVLRGHEHVITRVVCHPSGGLLASTSHDDTTRLWSFAPPGGELVLPGEHLHGFSRDGRQLTTSSWEGVTQWEIADPRGCVHYLPHGEVPPGGGWGAAFAPDSRLLASASPDGVLLWDAATARPIGRVPSGGGHSLAFSPDGRDLFTTGPGRMMRWPIVGERDGRVLCIGPGTVLRETTADGRALRIDVASRGGSLLLGAEDGGVDIIPLAAPERARRLGTHDHLFAVAISPDGRWAISAAGYPDEDFCVWDIARGVRVRRFPSGGDYPAATFSPDGRTLVTSVRTRFSFWDVGSWEAKASIPRAPRSLEGLVRFTRDGSLLALSQGRHQIQLHDAATLRRLATLETPAGPANVVGLSLSPDGTRLAVATDYNVVVLWDLRRLREELSALDLDWEMPPYPPSGSAAESAEPLTAEVIPASTSAP